MAGTSCKSELENLPTKTKRWIFQQATCGLPEGLEGYHSPPGCHPMAARQGHANHVSFNASITACERGSRWTLALQLLQAVGSCGGALELWEVSQNYGKIVYIMRCHGMSWHVMACHGMSWHVMACHGIYIYIYIILYYIYILYYIILYILYIYYVCMLEICLKWILDN